MASIHLNISYPDDTEEEKVIVEQLQSLVDSDTSPRSCAEKIDHVIVADCAGSSILGWQHHLWNCIGKAAMDVPANHPGQDNLVTFLLELQRLPRHRITYHVGEEVFEKEMWSLTPANRYDGFEQWMWDLNQGIPVGAPQADRSDDPAPSYQNFSAFLARLLSGGVVEATRLSALVRPSLFGDKSPSGSSAARYEPYVCAAAQWILHAGRALFEMCEKETVVEIGPYKWTPAVWKMWKVKFVTVLEMEQFGEKCHELVARVVERMSEIEQEGVTTDVVSIDALAGQGFSIFDDAISASSNAANGIDSGVAHSPVGCQDDKSTGDLKSV
nr:hypothetical protein CFP56_16935 [Quercus suber]